MFPEQSSIKAPCHVSILNRCSSTAELNFNNRVFESDLESIPHQLKRRGAASYRDTKDWKCKFFADRALEGELKSTFINHLNSIFSLSFNVEPKSMFREEKGIEIEWCRRLSIPNYRIMQTHEPYQPMVMNIRPRMLKYLTLLKISTSQIGDRIGSYRDVESTKAQTWNINDSCHKRAECLPSKSSPRGKISFASVSGKLSLKSRPRVWQCCVHSSLIRERGWRRSDEPPPSGRGEISRWTRVRDYSDTYSQLLGRTLAYHL